MLCIWHKLRIDPPVGTKSRTSLLSGDPTDCDASANVRRHHFFRGRYNAPASLRRTPMFLRPVRARFAAACSLTVALVVQGCAFAPPSGPAGGEPPQRAADPIVARLAEGGFVIYI